MRITFINLVAKGGMLHYTMHLTNALTRVGGIRVTAILPAQADVSGFLDTTSIVRVPAPTSSRPAELPRNALSIFRIPGFLRSVTATAPDVVHVNSSHVWIVPTAGVLSRRIPMFATVHDVTPHPGENTVRKRLERRAVFHHASNIVVHSELLRNRLLSHMPQLRRQNVIVAPRGPSLVFSNTADTQKDKNPTVLFFGRIIKYKGVETLIAAAKLVRDKIPNVRFLVVGPGNIKPYATQLANESLFEVVNEFVPDATVGEYFGRAWLLALPYNEASWSGVASIAHHFSIPIVATSVGCLPELVLDDVNGYLVPAGDADAFADRILQVLGDANFRRRVAAQKTLLDASDWDAAAEIICESYRQAATRRQKVCRD